MRSFWPRFIALVLTVGLVPRHARAEPPDPQIAVAMSLGTTFAGALLIGGAVGLHAQDPGNPWDKPLVVGMAALGSVAAVVGPTLGHTYAGQTWSRWLGVRLSGAAAGLVGLTLIGQATGCGPNDEGKGLCDAGVWLVAGGAISYTVGMCGEIASASGAAARARTSGGVTTIGPLATPGGVGLALGGAW